MLSIRVAAPLTYLKLTPTQFLETINAINEILISAHSLKHSLVDNALSFFTLQTSRLVLSSHYEKVSNFPLAPVPGTSSRPLLAICSMAQLTHPT